MMFCIHLMKNNYLNYLLNNLLIHRVHFLLDKYLL